MNIIKPYSPVPTYAKTFTDEVKQYEYIHIGDLDEMEQNEIFKANPDLTVHDMIFRQHGSIFIQADIDSYADTCDMNYIVSRLQAGDRTVLLQRNPAEDIYADVSEFSDNPINLRSDIDRIVDNINNNPEFAAALKKAFNILTEDDAGKDKDTAAGVSAEPDTQEVK